jgi:methylmalonyl-CoA/ethylmalonyl-CoA epimerase
LLDLKELNLLGLGRVFAADAPGASVQFHHAGVATGDAAALVDCYGELLGLELAHAECFDGMAVRFLDCGNSYLELLEPLGSGGDSPIARHLDRRGPGLHHVAFEAEDVSAALERARALGIDPIDEEPRPGAWGHEVAFLHPESTGGVLVEFVGEG